MTCLKQSLLLFVVTLLLASGALADTFTMSRESFAAADLPGYGSELDEFADSINYFDPAGALWYFNGAGGIYSFVRYTAPADFQLQGLSIKARDITGITPFNVYVYADNNGSPGLSLATQFIATPIVAPQGNSVSQVEGQFDPINYVDLTAGTDFWISVQVANINAWMPYFDEEATGTRNWYGNSPSVPSFSMSGDWFIAAGGLMTGTFYDVQAVFLSNDLRKFHLLEGESTGFETELVNNGLVASPAGTLTFSVQDDIGATIWASDVAIPALAPGQTLSVVSVDEWTAPTTEMRYMARVDFPLPDDGLPDDNTYLLQQQVIEYGETVFLYDDGESEGNVVVNLGAGSGNIFYPPAYPAQLVEVTFTMNTDPDNVNAVLMVFTLDDQTGTITLMWSQNGADAGTNTYIMPGGGFEVQSGGWFVCVAAEGGTCIIPQDNTPPVSASNNPSLHLSAMPYASGTYLASDPTTLYVNTSGNWMIQALIDGELPPDPPELVFPEDIIPMDGAYVGEPLSVMVPIENNGIGFGIIDEITNYLPSQMEIPDAANLPITIDPGTIYEMECIWTPLNENYTQIGVHIGHNDPGLEDPYLIMFAGTAFASDVADGLATIPSEYFLDQNRPNPFNPETTIKFGLKAPGMTTLRVFNVMGQEIAQVVNSEMPAGEHTVSFNGSDLTSGVYFYSLEVNGYQSIQKMVLMK